MSVLKTAKPYKKNNRKPQNRNKFRSQPKTASKIREAVHAIEVVEAHIIRRETETTPSPNSKSRNPILFLPEERIRTETANRNGHQNQKAQDFWF